MRIQRTRGLMQKTRRPCRVELKVAIHPLPSRQARSCGSWVHSRAEEQQKAEAEAPIAQAGQTHEVIRFRPGWEAEFDPLTAPEFCPASAEWLPGCTWTKSCPTRQCPWPSPLDLPRFNPSLRFVHCYSCTALSVGTKLKRHCPKGLHLGEKKAVLSLRVVPPMGGGIVVLLVPWRA